VASGLERLDIRQASESSFSVPVLHDTPAFDSIPVELQLEPTLGSVGVAVIVSSSCTALCVVEPHGSANAVTKFDVASSCHQKRQVADKQALDGGPGTAWQAGWSGLTYVKPLNLLRIRHLSCRAATGTHTRQRWRGGHCVVEPHGPLCCRAARIC